MENEEKKKRQIHYDRVTVSKLALERLDNWVSQIHSQTKGIFVNKNDLVKWLVESHTDTLTQSELKEIEKMFYNEMKFANWALKEFRLAKARGEDTTLADIINRRRGVAKDSQGALNTKAPRKKKQTQSELLPTDLSVDTLEKDELTVFNK